MSLSFEREENNNYLGDNQHYRYKPNPSTLSHQIQLSQCAADQHNDHNRPNTMQQSQLSHSVVNQNNRANSMDFGPEQKQSFHEYIPTPQNPEEKSSFVCLQVPEIENWKLRDIEKRLQDSKGQIEEYGKQLQKSKLAKLMANLKVKSDDADLEDELSELHQGKRQNRKRFAAIFQSKGDVQDEEKSAELARLRMKLNRDAVQKKLIDLKNLQRDIQKTEQAHDANTKKLTSKTNKGASKYEIANLQRLGRSIVEMKTSFYDLLNEVTQSREYQSLATNLDSEIGQLKKRTMELKELTHVLFRDPVSDGSSSKCSFTGLLKWLCYLVLTFATFPGVVEAVRRDLYEDDWPKWFYVSALILQFLMVIGFVGIYAGLSCCKRDQNNECFSARRLDKFKDSWGRYGGPVQCILAIIIVCQYGIGLFNGVSNIGYWAQIVCNSFLVFGNLESLRDVTTNRICICCGWGWGDQGLKRKGSKLYDGSHSSQPMPISSSMSANTQDNLPPNSNGPVVTQRRVGGSTSQNNYTGPVVTQRNVGGRVSQQRKTPDELIFFY